MKTSMKGVCALFFCLIAAHVHAAQWMKVAEKSSQDMIQRTATVQHNGAVEVGFSPHAGAEALVLKAINSARSEIRVLSYSFTSAPVTRALLDAKRRGVDVALIVDYKSNVQGDQRGKAKSGKAQNEKAKHALSALVNAGCRVRTISIFPIHHDKTIIVDRETVETGSFNYSDAAANKNSENVIVLWKNPDLARVYLAHWEDRFDRGQDFQTNY